MTHDSYITQSYIFQLDNFCTKMHFPFRLHLTHQIGYICNIVVCVLVRAFGVLLRASTANAIDIFHVDDIVV